jgi:hypothetical protein
MGNDQSYKLPEYLGLGILDRDSVVRTDTGVKATYSSNNDLVYSVDWTMDMCRLEEFFEGKSFSITMERNLAFAISASLKCIELTENPRLAQLSDQISHMGNVNIQYPSVYNFNVFYPAGLIFLLRQPIMGSNYIAWYKLKSIIEANSGFCPIQIQSERQALTIKLHFNQTYDIGTVTLVDLGCKLVDLVKAAEICCRNGLVPDQLVYCLCIGEALYFKRKSFHIFRGGDTVGYKAFAILNHEPELTKKEETCDEISCIMNRFADSPTRGKSAFYHIYD